MRKVTVIVVMALSLCALFMVPSAIAKTFENAPASFADMVETLTPAVVNISSTQKAPEMPMRREIPGMQDLPDGQSMPDIPRFPEGSPFNDFFQEFMDRRDGLGMRDIPMIPEASLGSGFVIDAEKGYIITNNHVIRDAEEVRVTFQDDETLDAEIIGHDEKTDLAVLKIDPSKKKLTAVKFGNSDVLRVGDWVVAIGNPFGLGGTVTAGIISARARDINAGPYDDFIQTDASINRGNSGGPMFDLNGEVIGINTAIFSPSGGSVGIGFAIPSALAKPVIDQIIEFGRTRRGWLGVRIQKVTDEIAEVLGLPKATGALIASVNDDGPAKAAGLVPGDIVLEFNGKVVDDMRELPRIVAETPIEQQVSLVYWRDGRKQTTSVVVAELEKAEEDGLIAQNSAQEERDAPRKDTEFSEFGFNILELDEVIRSDFGIHDDVQGLFINRVEPMSEAAKKGLYEGDVIIEMNQQPVSSIETAKDVVRDAVENKRSSVLMLINRDGDMRFVALKLPEEPVQKDKR